MGYLVGVLGGLGPQATVYFLQSVIDMTEAKTDQEHVNLIVTQHSSTPDRTAAILHGAPSPAHIMAADARNLQQGGADFLVIPCNTATPFLQAVIDAVDIEVVNIVTETVKEIRRLNPTGVKHVGVMATEGTIRSGIYQEALDSAGYVPIIPTQQVQTRISSIIFDYVKAGIHVPPKIFFEVINQMRQAGADAVVCGCTELSVAYKDLHITDPTIVDSLASLARLTVIKAGKHLRKGL